MQMTHFGLILSPIESWISPKMALTRSSLLSLSWYRPADGEHRPACAVPSCGLQPACHVPAARQGLWWEGAAIHRQWGAEECGGQVQRLAAHHTESSGIQEGVVLGMLFLLKCYGKVVVATLDFCAIGMHFITFYFVKKIFFRFESEELFCVIQTFTLHLSWLHAPAAYWMYFNELSSVMAFSIETGFYSFPIEMHFRMMDQWQ